MKRYLLMLYTYQAIRHEAFTHMDGQKEFIQIDQNDLFPYLLVNIGSGVSIIKVFTSFRADKRLTNFIDILNQCLYNVLILFNKGGWVWQISKSKRYKCRWWYLLGIGPVINQVQQVLLNFLD